MVKMAYVPLPNLLCKLINTSNMCPTDFTTKTSLPDILQSESVKRLFNQPNIIIKTIPLKTPIISKSSHNHAASGQLNSFHAGLNKLKTSDLSVFPLQISNEEDKDDENLLPSKKNDKSEVSLVPIKKIKKPCGHYEPCENIVCDVAVQQYADRSGVSPMLAFNIEEHEINAPVSKHCANKKCDALSIDHNRCRRAMLRLNRCDQSRACDICGITLKTQRSRISHKNCVRKNEYRHNETSCTQIMRVRMREREIQLTEAAKLRKNDYLDPVTGFNLAMETLKKNKELIVIPKSQKSSVTTTIKSNLQINNANNIFRNFLSSIPVVLPQQSIVVGKSSSTNETKVPTPVQVAIPDALNGSILTTTAVPFSQNQYVTFTTQSNEQPIKLNDILLSQSQVVTTPIQPKPLITPIRVVPITNLITEPSLLHQAQGIPKFCIMADNTVPPISITNSQPTHPAAAPKVEISTDTTSTSKKTKKLVVSKRKKLKKKDFKCNYCLKHFSTNWYFKMHVAMHEGGKQFSCKACTQSFNNRYDLKKHMWSEHENENTCNQEKVKYKCSECDIVCMLIDDLRRHKRKCHEKTECTFCYKELLLEELDDHIESMHRYEREETLSGKNDESSSITDSSINNINVKQEVDIHKTEMNGYTSISEETIMRDIKTELMYEA